MKELLVKLMHSKRHFWLNGLAVLVTLLASASAHAQDFGTFKGNNQRTGNNGDVLGSGPGPANLRWFYPNATPNEPDQILTTIIRDNNSSEASRTPGPGWIAPPDNEIAANVYDPQTTDPLVATSKSPYYYYARPVRADFSGNPTIPYGPDAGGLRTFTWQMTPPAAEFQPRGYALYVWLPAGGTGGSFATSVFKTRYFVYQVTYANGLKWTDVIDTYAVGTGWVRLGNNGNTTNRMFPFDGVNPLKITLFNTVPRDSQGNLPVEDRNPTPTDPTQQTIANDVVVYADAVRAVPESGYYAASPIVSQVGGFTATVAVKNFATTSIVNDPVLGQIPFTTYEGRVSSYQFNTGLKRWDFNIPASSNHATLLDNTVATASPNWTLSTANGSFIGGNYLTDPLQSTSLATADTADYKPTLEDGSYFVEVYVGGDGGGETFGTAVTYQIFEGAAVTNVTVDLSQRKGWVRLGNRRFAHQNGVAELHVTATNFTTNGADVTAGRLGFSDAVRFIGAVDLTVRSTPIQVEARVRMSTGEINPTPKPVVVVAAEDGRIYCLDAVGNGAGGTNIIWAYPSLPDPSNPSGTDPNLQGLPSDPIANKLDGEQGVLLAEMPTGFDLSSAVIQNVGGEDLLYIGGTNGRVYCIEMAGRGDVNFATGKPGTTKRRWTYPDDYPSIKVPSALGPFEGSVVFSDTTQGPTIFAPTSQGRIYALNAAGNAATRTTTPRWTFPALTQPTLGPITTTPAIDHANPTLNHRMFFGTSQKNDTVPGQFFSIDTNTGAVNWVFETDGTTPALNFLGGPAYVNATDMLGGGTVDTVFASNTNGYIYAFNAAGVGGNPSLVWETNEIGGDVVGPLSVTTMTVFDNVGTGNTLPEAVVMVPTTDGRFIGLFARNVTNREGGKLAWFVNGSSEPETAGIAVGRNWMYTADGGGNLYAFNSGTGAYLTPGVPPDFSQGIVPNDPASTQFNQAKIVAITKPGYLRAMLPPGDPARLQYTDIGTYLDPMSGALEWGQRAYFLVYDFPYDPGGGNPFVTFQVSSEGNATRRFAIGSRQFDSPPAPAGLDGYAVLDLPIQGSGASGVLPGSGKITFTINYNSKEFLGAPSNRSVDFFIANPLAISMTPADPARTRSLGQTVNANDPQNITNNSFDIPATPMNETLVGTAPAPLNHGGSGQVAFYVTDRSLMTLQLGPGRGLNNVRVYRPDLARQGGLPGVWKPLPAAYGNFEDYPTQFPNVSLDYPDLGRDRIRVTKDPNGTPENPTTFSVSLTPPSNVDELAPQNRILHPTPFMIDIDVPKYTPPVINGSAASYPTFTDSASLALPSGFLGRMKVFVDSDGNGVPSQFNRRDEAQRAFTLSAAVLADEKIEVPTATVDLQSLAGGTGLPLSTFSPWSGNYVNLFKPFVVRNEGNGNLLNLRMAKATNIAATFNPWPIYSDATEDLGWFDSMTNLWSDIDATYAITSQVILQKSRVGDRSGTELATNPVRRPNANLGVTGLTSTGLPDAFVTTLNGSGGLLYPPKPPRVAVTIPIGFPVGTYSQVLRVIEDSDVNESLKLSTAGEGLETYSDPTLTLKFLVRETRMTTTTTKQPQTGAGTPPPMTAPMIDNFAGSTFNYSNVTPTGVRDLNGNLYMMWASDRPTFNPAGQPTETSQNNQWRLYFASLAGQRPNQAGGGISWLHDLNMFQPSGATWFKPSPQTTNGWPNVTPALFLTKPSESLVLSTVKFGAPAFPGGGFVNPFVSGATYSSINMAFIGTVQKQTVGGRSSETRLFVAPLQPAGLGGLSLGQPVPMPYDADSTKGKPTVVQAPVGATVMYSSVSAGQSRLMWTFFSNNTFSVPQGVPMPTGMESATGPSATGRHYQGPTPPLDANGVAHRDLVEFTFTGKLRGRSNTEVFMGRFAADGNGMPLFLAPLSSHRFEFLTSEREQNVYRTQGLGWILSTGFSEMADGTGPVTKGAVLQQWIDRNGNGVIDDILDSNASANDELVNLEIPNTRTIDPDSGIISFDTRLGGKAYLDPGMGTVRLSAGLKSRRAVLILSYQPCYVRISSNTAAGFQGSTLMYDDRFTTLPPDAGGTSLPPYLPEFWGNSGNTRPAAGDPIRDGRYIVSYGRAASGAGQAARPFMQTFRYGIDLHRSIYTRPDGSLIAPGGGPSITVAGLPAGSFYQVDPAKGKVYFTSDCEDISPTITFTGVDPATGVADAVQSSINLPVTLIVEREESPIPIEQASNETNVAAFLDPFDGQAPIQRRPGLIWLFWASTRAGNPDIYFQTIAPRFTPVIGGR